MKIFMWTLHSACSKTQIRHISMSVLYGFFARYSLGFVEPWNFQQSLKFNGENVAETSLKTPHFPYRPNVKSSSQFSTRCMTIEKRKPAANPRKRKIESKQNVSPNSRRRVWKVLPRKGWKRQERKDPIPLNIDSAHTSTNMQASLFLIINQQECRDVIRDFRQRRTADRTSWRPRTGVEKRMGRLELQSKVAYPVIRYSNTSPFL